MFETHLSSMPVMFVAKPSQEPNCYMIWIEPVAPEEVGLFPGTLEDL